MAYSDSRRVTCVDSVAQSAKLITGLCLTRLHNTLLLVSKYILAEPVMVARATYQLMVWAAAQLGVVLGSQDDLGMCVNSSCT
jgi:hypothetical protein